MVAGTGGSAHRKPASAMNLEFVFTPAEQITAFDRCLKSALNVW
jgi:hypothetical protein